MKILVGCLYHETNTFNPFLTNINDFVLLEGGEAAERVASTEVFRQNGVEIIPSIYATGLSSGIVANEAYRYFTDKILDVLKREPEIDGIWFHLHGSMVVEGIGSGELALLKEVREYVGGEIPISLTLDIHANISEELYKYVNIVRSYRTVPHVDQPETEKITARILMENLNQGTKIRPSFVRLPLLICGEKALGERDPLRSIFNKLEEVEERKGISTASFFICHAWSDSENTASSIFVTPQSEKYEGLADEVSRELAEYVYNKRYEFEFDAIALEPEEAVERALMEQVKPVFISDSGDNTTAGATGMNTLLLNFLTDKDIGDKKVAIAAINDAKAFDKLNAYEIGDKVSVKVGMNYDRNSTPISIEGTLKTKGDLLGYLNATNDKVGEVCTVSVGNVDVVIANSAESFITINHFVRAGLDINEYDVVVIKQGYLFDELSSISKLDVLAMTPGATFQKIDELDYQHIPQGLHLQ